MRRCGRCGQIQAVDAFGFRWKSRGVRHTICQGCQAVYRAAYNVRIGPLRLHARIREHTERYRDRNRLFVDAYLRSHPCVDCGEPDIIVLEFDHVGETKTRSISVMLKHATSLATLQAEIAKCQVRCANCHRRRTAQQYHRRRFRLAGKQADLDLDEVPQNE